MMNRMACGAEVLFSSRSVFSSLSYRALHRAASLRLGTRLVSLTFVLVLISGCVVEQRRAPDFRLPQQGGSAVRGGSVPRVEKFAWETWPTERTLEGGALRNPAMLRGDSLLDRGKRREALAEYQRVKTQDLSSQEKDALMLRIASTQLSLRQPKPALSTVSSYFKSAGKSVEDADQYFSLVLGFGYAALADVDQSFAWLSRARRVGARSAPVGNAANFGVSRVVQSLEPDRIELLADSWRVDSFISAILGQERRRRSFGSGAVGLGAQGDALYQPVEVALAQEREAAGLSVASEMSGGEAQAAVGSGVTVGVILPLSGKFASLGTSVKNGIELALSSSTQPPVTPQFRDDAGTVGQSVSLAQELSSTQHAAFILGPLLSEAAEAVAASTSEASSPVISYSKKETFSGGRGAFRLGATASSQVKSLFNAIEGKLGLTRLAMVFPDDEAGREYARLFREAAQQRSMTLVYEASYRRTEPDALISIAAQVEQAKPDGLFFPDNILEATRFFSALKPAARQAVTPLGPASWDNESQLNRSKNALEGAVFVSPFFAGSRKEIIVRFIEAYQARYRVRPDFLAAQGFDSATLALAALRKQTGEGLPFAQALAAVERYEGLTGTIQVQLSGEIERNFEVVALSRGVVTEVQERKPETYVGRGNDVVVEAPATGR